MELTTITGEKRQAHSKWREYRNAEKAQPDNKMYTELKKMYWNIKHGRCLIELDKVIKAGGRYSFVENDSNSMMPKLAICQAHSKFVDCQVYIDGRLTFSSRESPARSTSLELPAGTLPTYTWKDGSTWRSMYGKAPLPIIPPNCMPKVLTDDHYILWEVERWEKVPPVDPVLCRRLSKNIFAVEAQWDLTPLERAVMAQYIQ